MDADPRIRTAAFQWLESLVSRDGEVLSRTSLARGFYYQGARVPLLGPQGIWKPAVMERPLSLCTVLQGPYRDELTDTGLTYAYRGTDPNHRDNRGLRECMQFGEPLVYFHAIVPGKYMACWPVYIVGDRPDLLQFAVALDDVRVLAPSRAAASEDPEQKIRRRYVTREVLFRAHQHGFRERVLTAYRDQCSMCRLKHRELLDASHIVPDREEGGAPNVQNGLALCKIHHAAFDRNILGITPDYEILVREDVLEEVDGPMLRYGLQELHRGRLTLPRSVKKRPSREGLEIRFEQFRRAG